MAIAKQTAPPLVQMYHKVREKEYTVTHHGLIFSYTDVVRTERISNELTLHIQTDREPDKILYNGKEVKLVPCPLMTINS